MKILLICFMFIFNIFAFKNVDAKATETSKAEVLYQEFINESKNIYDEYYEITSIKNNDYIYSVVVGKYQSSRFFDVFLYENSGANHLVRIDIGDNEYSIEPVDQRYFSTHGIQNNETKEIIVYIFGGIMSSNEVTIEPDYSLYVMETGLGNGPILSYMDPIEPTNKAFVLIILISIIVIFGALIGIGIVYIFKVGKFKVKPTSFEKKSNTIEIGVVTDSDPISQGTIEDDEEESYSDAKVYNEEPVSVYDKDARYDEDEEIPDVDIESLLFMKGYKTDYSIMTEEEKNDVMVYLMILRKTNQISSSQYQKEVVKLWKK